MNLKKITSWCPGNFATHLLINLAAMAVVGCILLWIMLLWLDSWTDHGHFEVVPEVKGMSYAEANRQLQEAGFSSELTDSIYDDKTRPGTVVEQNPKSGTKVKEGRLVYLTITAFAPKAVTLPLVTDVSLRQARSVLEGVGLTNVNVVEVPSEYRGLVLAVKSNGQVVLPGTRMPVTSHLTLEVGTGYSDEQADSLFMDSIVTETVEIVEE